MDNNRHLWTKTDSGIGKAGRQADIRRQPAPSASRILASLHEAVFATDANGVVTFWNAPAGDLFGMAASDAIGRAAWTLFGPTIRPARRAIIRALAASGRYAGELECRHADGRRLQVDVRARLMCDRQGRVHGAVFSVRDSTDRHAARQAELAGQTQVLNEIEAFRQADKRKNRLLNTISHELRNPLAAVTMGLSLLKQIPPDGTLARTTVEMLERQASQLTRLVDDLLDATRIDASKIRLHLCIVDINSLVDRLLDDHQNLFIEKRIKLRADLSPDPLLVRADPHRLNQIIGNLLHNAWKFTESGGTVTVATRLLPDADSVEVSVRDSGIGIAPERLGELFLPYSQVDNSLEFSNGGLGLGLSIARGLAELHGGRLEAASDGIHKGTCFSVHLPYDPALQKGERLCESPVSLEMPLIRQDEAI